MGLVGLEGARARNRRHQGRWASDSGRVGVGRRAGDDLVSPDAASIRGSEVTKDGGTVPVV